MRVNSYPIQAYMAGDYRAAHELCRRHCFDHPFCVNLSRRDFIYWAGAESGVMVEIVNYPRFPKPPGALYEHAKTLAVFLATGLCQKSFLIQTPEWTEWWTWDEEDKEFGLSKGIAP